MNLVPLSNGRPVPLISLNMNRYSLCFSMHQNLNFCHQYVWQNMSEERRYRAYHLTMQAGRPGIVDIDRAIDQSYIPLDAWMALKWNNRFFCKCIGIYMGFWYKNHVGKKFNVYNTLIVSFFSWFRSTSKFHKLGSRTVDQIFLWSCFVYT